MLSIREKIKMSNDLHLSFADMSPRRRFSYELEDMIVREIKNSAKYATGTSNVHLAMKYDMKPIGTMNHYYISFTAARTGSYIHANQFMMRDWIEVFGIDLGIALTDCYTNDIFLNDFTKEFASLFKGVRHDSGDEIEYTDKIVAKYKELGIDPLIKTIVFSNALTFPKYAEIAKYCEGKIKCSAGIGTNLACDIPGVKATNIVMKLVRTRMNERSPWINTVKISDEPGKATGHPEAIRQCLDALGLRKTVEDNQEPGLYYFDKTKLGMIKFQVIPGKLEEYTCEKCQFNNICETLKDPNYPEDENRSFMDYCGKLDGLADSNDGSHHSKHEHLLEFKGEEHVFIPSSDLNIKLLSR